ncbi:unnamed protein product [Linum trigynum]|uniref:Uncharacterized protein n=1 Tax=Linum trigynum TaxID=586398 RepID=A0AAV2CIR9_9ROSI
MPPTSGLGSKTPASERCSPPPSDAPSRECFPPLSGPPSEECFTPSASGQGSSIAPRARDEVSPIRKKAERLS